VIRHYTAVPSDYVIKYSRGDVRDEGTGLSFVYNPWTTKIVSVPTTSMDASFAFKERTSDFQPVNIEGDIVYRIAEPKKAASALDFTVGPRNSRHREDALKILKKRIVGVARDLIRDEVGELQVEDAMTAATRISRSVKIRMAHSGLLNAIGVRVMSVLVKKIMAPSEIVSAVEAGYLDSIATKGRQSNGTALLLAGPRMNGGPAGSIADVSVPGPVQCTDSCPFRHMCGDYMDNIQDGNARCTLFREFPV
jgi:hypothetical protein